MITLKRAIKHKITIEASDNNGFLVRIGCGTFVAETKKSLLAKLTEYLEDPEKLDEKYKEIAGSDNYGIPDIDMSADALYVPSHDLLSPLSSCTVGRPLGAS